MPAAISCDRAGGVSQFAGHVVHEADAPQHEAATMEVDDDTGWLAVAPVDPNGNAADIFVIDVADLTGGRRADRPPGH